MVEKANLLKPFDVDTINIRRDRYFTNAYVVDLPLDSTPDHVWRDIFERTWKSSRHLWDRKLFVMADRLRLVTPADDFGKKLDWIEQVIDETNKSVEKHDFAVEKEKEMRAKKELDKQRLWEERATIERMKETLRIKYT